MALRSLGEHSDASDDVGGWLEIRQLLAVPAAALVAGADAADAAVVDEQLRRGGLRQDHRATFLGLVGEPAAQFRQRGDAVPVVPHRRRRRDPDGTVARQEVDGLLINGPVEGHFVQPLASGEEPLQRAWIDDGAGEQVRACLLPLLDHGDRHLAEALGDPGRVLQELPEPDRAREPGRARADDHDPDLDPLVLRIGRRRDRLRDVERGWELGRSNQSL